MNMEPYDKTLRKSYEFDFGSVIIYSQGHLLTNESGIIYLPTNLALQVVANKSNPAKNKLMMSKCHL